MNITKRTSIGFIISGTILTAIFCFVFIFDLASYIETKSIKDSTTQISAVCTECFVHTDESAQEFFISVEYTYNAQTFTAEDIIADKQYQAGESVTVYVSSENPNDARLTPPESKFNIISVAVLIPFAVLGILLILVGIKEFKKAEI